MIELVYYLAAIAAGIAAALQGAANSGLSARTGTGAALIVNTVIVLTGAVVFFVASGAPATFLPPGTPVSLYIGGICGFSVILAAVFVFPKIGAAAAVALMVLGQGIAALAIDHYGLMGIPTSPITLSRTVGFGLIVAGVVLLRA